ncbi:ATPase [Vibrio ziniensis]|uniref:ATPase n=1 Tax=Vibrio ziniensis TaxID=2711221 RepID=A0A6G7CHB9_9VIBR|nr:ATPase [Vibrio ziniensis]QIH41489.1 ATPase [Vibrio ziniensis]
MDKKELLKSYFQATVESAKIAKTLSLTLDDIRQSSLKFDHARVSELNQNATELSEALRKLHFERKELAVQLGCRHHRYATDLVHRMSGKAQETIKKATDELHELVLECQNKTELHTRLVIQQQQVIKDAVDSLRVEVNA